MLYEIKGKQVMLDSDLARLYECKNGTKSINLAVNRHLDRFRNDFYFQITNEEYNKYESSVRKLPYAFTEQVIAMLFSVLYTEAAINMTIKIMEVFVVMRHLISNNLIEQKII